jgi:hypothetical protein
MLILCLRTNFLSWECMRIEIKLCLFSPNLNSIDLLFVYPRRYPKMLYDIKIVIIQEIFILTLGLLKK